jgi:putative FmdB family regulatory protein
MPLYEYACNACAHQFELLVRGAERRACPRCASEDLERRLSAFAAHTSGASAHASPAPVDSCNTCGSMTPGACGPNYEMFK